MHINNGSLYTIHYGRTAVNCRDAGPLRLQNSVHRFQCCLPVPKRQPADEFQA